eukprot:9475413-Pyramimonas_sp.AAC.1
MNQNSCKAHSTKSSQYPRSGFYLGGSGVLRPAQAPGWKTSGKNTRGFLCFLSGGVQGPTIKDNLVVEASGRCRRSRTIPLSEGRFRPSALVQT